MHTYCFRCLQCRVNKPTTILTINNCSGSRNNKQISLMLSYSNNSNCISCLWKKIFCSEFSLIMFCFQKKKIPPYRFWHLKYCCLGSFSSFSCLSLYLLNRNTVLWEYRCFWIRVGKLKSPQLCCYLKNRKRIFPFYGQPDETLLRIMMVSHGLQAHYVPVLFDGFPSLLQIFIITLKKTLRLN